MSLDFLIPISTYPDPTPTAGLRLALNMVGTMGGKAYRFRA